MPCARLSWPPVSFWAHVSISYRIVTHASLFNAEPFFNSCCFSRHFHGRLSACDRLNDAHRVGHAPVHDWHAPGNRSRLSVAAHTTLPNCWPVTSICSPQFDVMNNLSSVNSTSCSSNHYYTARHNITLEHSLSPHTHPVPALAIAGLIILRRLPPTRITYTAAYAENLPPAATWPCL